MQLVRDLLSDDRYTEAHEYEKLGKGLFVEYINAAGVGSPRVLLPVTSFLPFLSCPPLSFPSLSSTLFSAVVHKPSAQV